MATSCPSSQFGCNRPWIKDLKSKEKTPSMPDPNVIDVASPILATSQGWVEKFIEGIHVDPFVSRYRGRPFGSVQHGWSNRLAAYFWPTPVDGLSVTTATLKSYTVPLRLLADKVLIHSPWTRVEQDLAVQSATGVFIWGRVLRSTPTPDQVRAAMEMAVHRETRLAPPPLNSTWTKLAAFSTEHLVTPHVIWDSRVATSVTWRLEQLFIGGGLSTVPYDTPEIPHNLGPMQVGRGGTRPRKLTLDWKNAYGRWPAQFAASEFVRSVRDVLNANSGKYSKSENQKPWTLREVEQVLFMDGY